MAVAAAAAAAPAPSSSSSAGHTDTTFAYMSTNSTPAAPPPASSSSPSPAAVASVPSPAPMPSSSSRSSSSAGRDATFAYLNHSPVCLVALDASDGRPVQANATFAKLVGPLYKLANFAFADNATEEHNGRQRLKNAIARAAQFQSAGASLKSDERCGGSSSHRDGDDGGGSARVQNVEIVTLQGEDGFPIKKHFDWTVGTGTDGTILLFGDRCNPDDVTAQDAEFVDMFQNAPIPLHWLNAEGIILWANNTELNLLGYTAEEYIGQPIMKFCPDEKELFHEILKRYGSGKGIKDVPVRFRTKKGKVVHLLIDSNIRYGDDGKFAHTRCFVRDDTGRKVQETRAKLMLEETKRQMKLLDNFMSRAMHHIRMPLQVMHSTNELVVDKLSAVQRGGNLPPSAAIGTYEVQGMLEDSNRRVHETVEMIDDIADLARFDQGSVLLVEKELIDVRKFCLGIIKKTPPPHPGVDVFLSIRDQSAAFVATDKRVLRRCLSLLLEYAIDATERGSVTLEVSGNNGSCMFSVLYTSVARDAEDGPKSAACQGTLPKIFQQYHAELVPEDMVDFVNGKDLQETIDKGLSSCKNNKLGIGSSLCYHLIRSLESDLRYSVVRKGSSSSCSSSMKAPALGMSKFWFSLPASREKKMRLSAECVAQGRLLSLSDTSSVASEDTSYNRKRKRDFESESDGESVGSSNRRLVSSFPPTKATNSDVANYGCYSAGTSPLVLVVEDTDVCATLLCRQLRNMDCSTHRAENGEVALEMLRSAMHNMYSLILMDLRMPIMDGFEATKIIKDDLKLQVPVIALTGETGKVYRDKCKEIGFDGFVKKPLKGQSLKDLLNEHIHDVHGVPWSVSTKKKRG